MKKIFCLLLSLLVAASMVACGEKNEKGQTPEENTKGTAEQTSEETTLPADVPLVDSFYMDLKEADQESAYYLQAFTNGDSTVYMDYATASGHKVANMDAEVLKTLTAAYHNSDLHTLDGQVIYEEAGAEYAACSVYISWANEACDYSFYGTEVPEDYAAMFAQMEAVFVQIMADVEEYAIQPAVTEGVDEGHKEELLEILDGSGIVALDSLAIMAVADDEYFSYNTGLTSADGIELCTSCTPIMNTTPYSMVLVTVAEGTDIGTVAEDFATDIDWLKWVCVQPNSATVATKDNMVLCLIGQDEMYTGTVEAMEAAGWTVVQTLTNPNL